MIPCLLYALAAAGCIVTETEHGAGVLVADPTRDGAGGRDGPLAVSRVLFTAQVRVSEGLPVEVTYPSTSDGRLDRRGAPFPAVVIVQGGFVPVRRYRWLSTHLASRGYVAIMPAHVQDVASFATDNGTLAVAAIRDAAERPGLLDGAIARDGPAMILGHSLGGRIAVRQWLTAPFTGVGLLAAFPADGEPVRDRAGSPVLSIVGENDTVKSPFQSYVDGFQSFALPRVMGVVNGMNHYAWTDDPSESELRGDGMATRSTADMRADALRMIDDWLDGFARGQLAPRTRLANAPYPGVTVLR